MGESQAALFALPISQLIRRMMSRMRSDESLLPARTCFELMERISFQVRTEVAMRDYSEEGKVAGQQHSAPCIIYNESADLVGCFFCIRGIQRLEGRISIGHEISHCLNKSHFCFELPKNFLPKNSKHHIERRQFLVGAWFEAR